MEHSVERHTNESITHLSWQGGAAKPVCGFYSQLPILSSRIPTSRLIRKFEGAMFFLFGQRWKEEGIGQFSYPCSQCSRPTFHTASVLRGSFTIFFIPLIPLGTRYILRCNICGLKRKAVDDLLRQIESWHRTGQSPFAVVRNTSTPTQFGIRTAARYCTSCGEALKDGAGFCTRCGARAAAAAEA